MQKEIPCAEVVEGKVLQGLFSRANKNRHKNVTPDLDF
jgi:hypothetical protein